MANEAVNFALRDTVDLRRFAFQCGAVHNRDVAPARQDQTPIEWNDVLLELERQGAPLRARDLEQQLLLAPYNLSRSLDRLVEGRGLIERTPDPNDGRSRRIRINEADATITRAQIEPFRALGGG